VARQRVSSGSPYESVFGFSRAVRVGDRVIVSGTAPIWEGDLFGDVRPARSMIVVAGLLDPRWRVEIEAEAVVGDGDG
jgi:enamine deaminase RidA (YjgF/YER057c/UK114 family)